MMLTHRFAEEDHTPLKLALSKPNAAKVACAVAEGSLKYLRLAGGDQPCQVRLRQ